MIKVAGHRLSTSQMEESLLSHPDVAEAAAIAAKDSLKGDIPIGFVVLKNGRIRNPKEIQEEIVKKVRTDIGAVACFKTCLVVDRLPKTRSGKILRGLMKKMVDGESYQVNPSIEDESVLPILEKSIKDHGLGAPK